MRPQIQIARNALLELGRYDLLDCIEEHERYGITIKNPCEFPHTVLKAVALAHQAAGHTVEATYEPGHAHFSCIECELD